ncbi:unnamed protein product, partial [Prorocentrum cordatum]
MLSNRVLYWLCHRELSARPRSTRSPPRSLVSKGSAAASRCACPRAGARTTILHQARDVLQIVLTVHQSQDLDRRLLRCARGWRSPARAVCSSACAARRGRPRRRSSQGGRAPAPIPGASPTVLATHGRQAHGPEVLGGGRLAAHHRRPSRPAGMARLRAGAQLTSWGPRPPPCLQQQT